MIYLDYNATTPLCEDAREEMLPYLDRHFGNPSSVHSAGREARAAIDDARDKLAALLRVKPHELIFTSGGTESCNLAVLGLARCRSSGGAHVISNKTEHHAVLNALEHLEKRENFEVTWLNVSRDGIVDLDQLAESIRPETRLVSIMTANNETGVIHPIREISEICRDRGVLLHSDMVQSFGKSDIDLSLVDSASFAAHKFYGPKAQDSFSCGVVCRFSQSCLAVRTRMSDDRGRKMSLQSLAWRRPRSGRYAIARTNRSVKRDCAMNCGSASQAVFSQRNKTVIRSLAWQIHSM